jgi:tetratricopeptide (TPR) repeat protein
MKNMRIFMTRASRVRSVWAVALVLGVSACSKESADKHVEKGDRYVAQSQLKEASIEYRAAIQIAPKRGDIRLKFANILMLQSDPAGALREYVRAADLMPRDANAQIRAGAMLLSAKAFEDAKARADRAIDIDPRNATAQVLRGNALAGLQDFAGAMSQYQDALALNPSQDAAYRDIATIQASKGQSAEAEASFRKAVDVAPKSIDARLSLASFLWANNRVPEAETVLKSALDLEPANLYANRAMGMLYVSTNRVAEAEPYFVMVAGSLHNTASQFSLADYYALSKRFDEARKILRDLGQQQVSHDAATIRLAAIAAAQGSRAQAIAMLREVLERRPKEAPARVVLARLLLEDNKREDALSELTQAVRDASSNSTAADGYMLIGTIHAANDRREDAIAAFEEVLRRQAQPVDAELALANLYLAGGDLDKAATLVKQALTVRPKDVIGRSLLVRLFASQRDFHSAEETLASLQKDFSNSVGVLELRGIIDEAQGKNDAARDSYAKAAAAAPTSIQLQTDLIRTDLAAGRRDDALKRVNAALKFDRSPDLLLLAATVYAGVGQADKAEELLTELMEAQPSRMQPYVLLGALYVGQERLNDGRERFEQAVAKNPKSVGGRTFLGIILERQQKFAEAEKQYRTVLSLDPRAPIASNNLAWMYVTRGENMDEALQLAQAAHRSIPEDPNVNDTLGWIYYKKHITEPAIQYLEMSTGRGPNDPSRHYHLGMAYLQAGDLQKAKKSLQRALALKADFEGADEARAALARAGG